MRRSSYPSSTGILFPVFEIRIVMGNFPIIEKHYYRITERGGEHYNVRALKVSRGTVVFRYITLPQIPSFKVPLRYFREIIDLNFGAERPPDLSF